LDQTNLKVLYIAGLGRNGSTLLARLLGEIEGCINVGEAARAVFDEELRSLDLPCGCGEKISDCPFWTKIISDIENYDEASRLRLTKGRYLPILLFPLKSPALRKKIEIFSSATRQMYKKISEVTGCRVIVDSSKHPANAYLLSNISNMEVRMLHLVRDPRDVAASWSTRKEYLPEFSVLRSAFWWLLYNVATKLVSSRGNKYLFVRYEDFVVDPSKILREALDWVHNGDVDLSFLKENQAVISLQHSLAGNPDKLIQGVVKIQRKKGNLPWITKAMISFITLPMLLRYGYSPFSD